MVGHDHTPTLCTVLSVCAGREGRKERERNGVREGEREGGGREEGRKEGGEKW